VPANRAEPGNVVTNAGRVFDPRALVVVGSGAAFGGILRFLIGAVVVARAGVSAAPYATLFINVSGSFLIGLALGTLQLRSDVSPLWRLFVATGILGGYTTFSTFSIDALALGSRGTLVVAGGYCIASVALGIGAASAGLALARLV